MRSAIFKAPVPGPCLKKVNTPNRGAFFRLDGTVFLKIRQDFCARTACHTKNFRAPGILPFIEQGPEMTDIYLTASSADDAAPRGFLCGGFFDTLKSADPRG